MRGVGEADTGAKPSIAEQCDEGQGGFIDETESVINCFANEVAMVDQQTIMNIINLPKRFLIEGDISMLSALQESGYFEVYNQIHEEDILNVLKSHSNIADIWLAYSADKRCSSGWFFEQVDNDKFLVDYYPQSNKARNIEYHGKSEACAAFIIREIENIRRNHYS